MLIPYARLTCLVVDIDFEGPLGLQVLLGLAAKKHQIIGRNFGEGHTTTVTGFFPC